MNLSESDTSDLIGMYQSGVSASEIIARFRIGYDTLYRILSRNNVQRRNAAHKRIDWDAETVKLAWAMYEAGLNAEQVGRHFGVGRYTAARILRANGYTLERGPRPVYDETLNERVTTLYQSGESIRSIAETVKRRPNTVSAILRNAGVELRGTNTGDVFSADDDDEEPEPPRWAVVAYRRRVESGMPEPVARKVSHLTHYNWSAVEAALQRVPAMM